MLLESFRRLDISSSGANYSPVSRQTEGVGGYDLRSPLDHITTFDYDYSGKFDHLVLYRPGRGAVFIVKNNNNKFSSVYAQGDGGSGIGSYDIQDLRDRIFAFDYNHSGKLDHLALYRPGTGTVWILKMPAASSLQYMPKDAQGPALAATTSNLRLTGPSPSTAVLAANKITSSYVDPVQAPFRSCGMAKANSLQSTKQGTLAAAWVAISSSHPMIKFSHFISRDIQVCVRGGKSWYWGDPGVALAVMIRFHLLIGCLESIIREAEERIVWLCIGQGLGHFGSCNAHYLRS